MSESGYKIGSQNGENNKKSRLYEEIADLLMQKIKDGDLRPGDKLPPERVLAEEMKVGRPVIREAIRSLELMGCIESRIGDGTYIRTPSIQNVMDPISMVFSQDKKLLNELIEVRLILETEVASLAAARRTEEQLLKLEKTLSDMEQEIKLGRNAIEQDEAFHKSLAEAAGNNALNTILGMCSGMLTKTTEVTQRMEGIPLQTIAQHRDILDAVAAGDEKRARLTMRKHLLAAQKNLSKI